jgi:hypothetical protein
LRVTDFEARRIGALLMLLAPDFSQRFPSNTPRNTGNALERLLALSGQSDHSKF